MQKAARLSNIFFALVLAAAACCAPASAEETVQFKNNESSLTRDIFEQNFYYEGTNYLHLDRLYRALFHKKARAKDINVFDEVPDNTFFTNRHSRKSLTEGELAEGFKQGAQPAAGSFSITGGHFGEINTQIETKDSSGEAYTLKFDHADHVELGTGAELIANRIYYALGYNVPQTTILNLDASQLVPAEGSKVVDGTGFSKQLSQEKLDQYLMFVAQNAEGKYRVLASKALPGEEKGAFKFQGRRRNDPEDGYDHETRREIRALRVFAAWLNHVDVRPENTMDVLQDNGGKPVLKHYLKDLSLALGSDSYGDKPANFGYENFVDFGETIKAIFGIGVWEKNWQKKWKEAGEKVDSPGVGYFDNKRFEPAKFKTQLPNYAFKDLTRADGFWAAKQLMSFKDSDIASIVKTAQYTNVEDADTITKVLAERRDIIAGYWFATANPLDLFDLQGGRFVFEDLAVKSGFAPSTGNVYHVDVLSKEGKRGKKITSFTSNETSFAVDPSWGGEIVFFLRVSRTGSGLSPYAAVEIENGKVSKITHQD